MSRGVGVLAALVLAVVSVSVSVAVSLEAAAPDRCGCNDTAPAPGSKSRVLLVWSSAPARAAAALLQATLQDAGYEHVSLQQLSPADGELCELIDNNLLRGEEKVLVSLATHEREPGCLWVAKQQLQVASRGVAPVTPRLHARLATEWQNSSACDFLALETLDKCGGFPPAPNGTEGKATKNLILYIPENEWQEERQKQCSSLRWLRCEEVSRSELAQRVENGTDSFLFLDAQLWDSEPSVRLLVDGTAPRDSMLVFNTNALLKHAPSFYSLLKAGFKLSHDELRAVLRSELHVEEAARQVAPRAANYCFWRKKLNNKPWRQVVVVICNDTELQKQNYIVDNNTNQYFDSTMKTKLKIILMTVDCNKPTKLSDMINKWAVDLMLWRTFGVVAPAAQAEVAAELAEKQRLPLLAYTPSVEKHVRSATGRPAHLAAALRELLDACYWRRVGLVSENSPQARALADALRAKAGLLLHEVSADAPEDALRELFERDSRIFFVNADAMTAERVLAAAAVMERAEEVHTPRVWLVRDYVAADGAKAALRPLSLSLEWRGKQRTNETRSFASLKDKWNARTWPRHAAALLDGLLTMCAALDRLFQRRDDALDYFHSDSNFRFFWGIVQNESFEGVVRTLQYDESGVRAPYVYLEQWSEEAQPRRLHEWPAGAGAPLACPVPHPPDDGVETCLMLGVAARPHDAYSPGCRDGTVLGSMAAGVLVLVALALGTVAARRWVARRDRRVARGATAKVLAQREAAFAELAPHVVEREALTLAEELGAGRFGLVRRGEVRLGGTRRAPAAVAVKTLREGASPAEESQFLREARLLATLHHDHVVRFKGVCWEDGPPLLLMELAMFGDLQHYLRARRHLAVGAEVALAPGEAISSEEAAAVSAEALTRLAREAAEALVYLGARGLVHRDVRAANCLVDARRSLKLADFGLARETGACDGEYACRGRALFPVLWMAPESLARGVATAASDVWSFGVLALELVTLGARPFGGAAPEAAVRTVLAGGRPPLPRDAAAETRALVLACWRREPARRPPAHRMAAWLARRACALQPALAPDLEEPECDSGIGEPEPGPPPDSRRSVSLLTLI